MLVSTYILSMAESTPMVQNKEHKSSNYSAQLSYCRIPGKIQLLQITETGDEELEPGGEAYFLNHQLGETKKGWIDTIYPFEKILWFAVFFKCGGRQSSQIIRSTSFVELDKVRDHKNTKISSGDRERVYSKTRPNPWSPVISLETEPEPDIQVMHEYIDERGRMNERIQAERQNGNKETRARDEEMLEIPREGDEASDLIMDKGGVLHADLRPEKLKREEISIERRN